MKLDYKIKIEQPETHYLTVTIKGERPLSSDKLSFFIPSWSPGSYLMREYGKHIMGFRALNSSGEVFVHQQTDKGVYEVDFSGSILNGDSKNFEISYNIASKIFTKMGTSGDSVF